MIRLTDRATQLFCLLSLVAASHLHASVIRTGTFTSDDELHFFNVSLASPSTLSIQTFGYGSAGGFDPYLSLFTQSGLLIAVNNDGTCPPLQASGGGICFDAEITIGAARRQLHCRDLAIRQFALWTHAPVRLHSHRPRQLHARAVGLSRHSIPRRARQPENRSIHDLLRRRHERIG